MLLVLFDNDAVKNAISGHACHYEEYEFCIIA
jgi:hypothetical protein